MEAVKAKWSSQKTAFFQDIVHLFADQTEWSAPVIEALFKDRIVQSGMKMGELMLPYRIMLVGGKFGPDVFLITALLGREEVIARINKALPLLE